MYLVLLQVAGCHDASRENPLDPDLTPAVEVDATLDMARGYVTLSWSPYEGREAFAEYWVLRRAVGRSQVDTLGRLSTAASNTYLDTLVAPNTAYLYRVSVLNDGGYEAPSPERRVEGFTVLAVSLLDWEIGSEEGAVQLRWSQYRGAGFGGYRIDRRSADQDEFEPLAEVSAAADTVRWIGGLEADLSYFFRIVVEAAGEEWFSNTSGRVSYGVEPSDLLAVHTDGLAGTAELTWTAYSGPGFEKYQVWRRHPDTGSQDLLAEFTDVADTTSVDTSLFADVLYSYGLTVHAAGRTLASTEIKARLSLVPVMLSQPEFSSATASARLSWSPYVGPRFAAYRVVRRIRNGPDEIRRELTTITDQSMDSWIDSSLVGNTQYQYQVEVETTREERVVSEEQGGGFHLLVDTWPLSLETDEDVRLSLDPDGWLIALGISPDRVRLLTFSLDGQQLAEQTILLAPDEVFTPTAVASAITADGGRRYGIRYAHEIQGALLADQYQLLEANSSGQWQWQYVTLQGDDETPLPDALPGRIQVSGVHALVDRVTATGLSGGQSGQVLMTDEFDGDEADSAWDYLSPQASRTDGYLHSGSTYQQLGAAEDTTWQVMHVEADVVLGTQGSRAGIRLGGVVRDYLDLSVDFESQAVTLLSRAALGGGSGSFVQPMQLPAGVPVRLVLDVADGQVRARIGHPGKWLSATSNGEVYAGLASTTHGLIMTAGNLPYRMGEDGALEALPALEAVAGELRVWEQQGRRASEEWMTMTLPEVHQVLVGRLGSNSATGNPLWAFTPSLSRSLGSGNSGSDRGQFLFPLSAAPGPDGRIYVLDAGNARIQIFTQDREYITWLGGSDTFDLRGGATGLRGSVVVDDQHYIYVADPANHSIRKFGP
ncbi:MAG: hypothetical protein HN712_00535 [Gemmatimonadetes bacterium]|nr:hypothetical protein [Gemmatimonadota bacterium]MBT7858755.1 hypothetical protein [Gemmatimonadota bacterium]